MEILFNFFESMGLNETLADMLSFFIGESIKIMALLLFGIFIFTLIRLKFLNENLVKKLENKPKIVVYLGMAIIGIFSPFCSCSTIPAFASFSKLGLPKGALFAFLITSPLAQETSILLLASLFGIPITFIYIAFAITVGLMAGVIISRIDSEKIFNENVLTESETNKEGGFGESCGQDCCETKKDSITRKAFTEALQTLKSTYKYVLIGIGIGALIHGVVPQELIKKLLGSSNIFAPILATLTGIPIYADDVALIPLVKSLLDSGAGLGTSISFLMASAVVSVPSFILLSSILKKHIIVKLAIFLSIAIITIGYILNFLQPFLIG